MRLASSPSDPAPVACVETGMAVLDAVSFAIMRLPSRSEAIKFSRPTGQHMTFEAQTTV